MIGSPGPARRGPGRTAYVASLALHLLVFVVLWVSVTGHSVQPPEFEVYRVDIVSPPPEAPVEEPLEQPPVIVSRPVEEQEPEPEPEPEAETEPRPATPVVEEPPPAPEQPTRGPDPEPEAAEVAESPNVQLPGEEFPYPAYLNNIIQQIYRHFRWTGTQGLRAEVYFVIRRDGTVSDIRLVEGSGDVAFNFEAMGAIEQAGRRSAFGPLPDGWSGERLPVLFEFRPAR